MGVNPFAAYFGYYNITNICRFVEFYFIVIPVLKSMRQYVKIKEDVIQMSLEDLKHEDVKLADIKDPDSET